LEREAKRLRSAQRRLHDLRRLAFPALGNKPMSSIRRSDVTRLLDSIEAEQGPVMADAVLSAIGKVMRDHARRSDDYAVPLVRGMARSRPAERARDRILSDPELHALWAAAESTQGPFGRLVQFCLATGCRRSEAAGMRRDEVSKEGIWTLPAARSKTKTAVARPLSKLAQAILARLPDSGDFFFSIEGTKPFNGFARRKGALDEASGIAGWRIHDLRRSSRSLMSRAGVNADIAERCLGHVIPGVRGTYDRHHFREEMLAAYEKLAALISHITNPQPNVVPMVQR
jgi:integrase